MNDVSPFEHLSVLISIVIGMGIAHLLASVHRLVQAGSRVRLYWLSVLWTVVVFVAQVEWWWASFELRKASLTTCARTTFVQEASKLG